MSLESMKCPSCGGQVYFDEDQEFAFCSHCGTQVYREDTHFDKKIEFEKHKIDANKELELERMKQNAKNKEAENKQDFKECILLVILIAIMFIGFAVLSSFLR